MKKALCVFTCPVPEGLSLRDELFELINTQWNSG